MKEKFEDIILTGPINRNHIELVDGEKKIIASWNTRKEDVIEHIQIILNEQDTPITLRGLYYKFVSRNWIPNYKSFYEKLGSVVTHCLYAGVIDWAAIKVDQSREMQQNYCVKGIEDALQDTVDQYKLDRQKDQDCHIEIWSEKNTLRDILSLLTIRYGLPLCIASGRESSPAIWKAYFRIRYAAAQGKNVKILYCGDHDPSGMDMVMRDIPGRLELMLKNSPNLEYQHEKYEYLDFIDFNEFVIPVALTMDQIEKYNLPHWPAKDKDTNYPWYILRILELRSAGK